MISPISGKLVLFPCCKNLCQICFACFHHKCIQRGCEVTAFVSAKDKLPCQNRKISFHCAHTDQPRVTGKKSFHWDPERNINHLYRISHAVWLSDKLVTLTHAELIELISPLPLHGWSWKRSVVILGGESGQ